MPGGSKKPVKAGVARAKAIARAIEDRRKACGIVVKQLLPVLELASASGWTKRIKTDRIDWVPFRSDEIAALVPVLSRPGELGWPYLDETAAQLLRDAMARAGGELRAAQPGKPLTEGGRSSRTAGRKAR